LELLVRDSNWLFTFILRLVGNTKIDATSCNSKNK
jgi:hypothetical protein